MDIKSSVDLIAECAERTKISECKRIKTNTCKEVSQSSVNNELDMFKDFISVVPKLSYVNIQKWVENQNERFSDKKDHGNVTSVQKSNVENIIDAVLQPDVIALIKSKLK